MGFFDDLGNGFSAAGSWAQHAGEDVIDWGADRTGSIFGRTTKAIIGDLGIDKILLIFGVGIAALFLYREFDRNKV